ncbi:histidine ammonia-lyase [Amycolatopsis sp. GM8]|uniref:HAL/PAL/TAL family ammonia-lyase n=1 Tax=Amycolatopsis sp. GM8 TaxID=2896530 RepID=UPI001F25F967|nr:aromatic amino acid ammonia-lyase [Amycolatopsis sp. GM8]
MLKLDGHTLRIDDVVHAASHPGIQIDVAADAARAMRDSRELKMTLIDDGQPIYGVTTGFGDSVTRQISPEKAAELQRNMIRCHLSGTGPRTPEPVVRATLLIRANCLARGHSAVNPVVMQRLLDLLRADVLPVIPQRGSVGASGDLVPLCYVAAALIGDGEVTVHGETRQASAVFAERGWALVEPEAKDALGLLNGTSYSAAWSTVALAEAEQLATVTDVCTALASEALLGNRGHFHEFIHRNRAHPGQITSARIIRELLDGSQLALTHSQVVDLNDPLGERGYQTLRRSIQDRYSIRCAPQITGVLRDTADWVRHWLEREINASTDNPLFDVDSHTVHSGGNFYGGHVVQAMDALKIAVANIADLLDRQLELLVDEKFNAGLTPNLIPRAAEHNREAGLHHGFKGMQLTASAMTAEALQRSTPASVFSRSTEAHNQDKVSMSPIAARGAAEIAGLARQVAAVHILAACQALDLRGAEHMSPRTRAVHDLIRDHIPTLDRDRRMDHDIATVVDLISNNTFAQIDEPRSM